MYGHRVCVGSGTPTRAVTQTYEVTDLVIPSIGKWVLAYRFDRFGHQRIGLSRPTNICFWAPPRLMFPLPVIKHLRSSPTWVLWAASQCDFLAERFVAVLAMMYQKVFLRSNLKTINPQQMQARCASKEFLWYTLQLASYF